MNNKWKFSVKYGKGISANEAEKSLDFLTDTLEDFKNNAPDSIESVELTRAE